jgi:hypothetical protein
LAVAPPRVLVAWYGHFYFRPAQEVPTGLAEAHQSESVSRLRRAGLRRLVQADRETHSLQGWSLLPILPTMACMQRRQSHVTRDIYNKKTMIDQPSRPCSIQ